MAQFNEDNLLDFLAEGFLRQGASVTFISQGEISALKVTSEDGLPKVYISAEEVVSKMAFLEGLISEEILIPVLKTEEEIHLKTTFAREGIKNIMVYRLPLQERYNWYSRKAIFKLK